MSRLDGITEALRGLSAALSSTNTNQPPTMSDAIYNHTTGRLHTCLSLDGVCMFTGKTVEQMQQESAEQLEVMPFTQALELTTAADRARYCTGPQRITQERYEEMLNVLPPENWQRGVGYSCFRLSERLSGAIASFFVRIGDRYRCPGDAMNLTITRKEAELLVQLLRPRTALLHELLEVQIQALPAGDDSWADTQDALRVANGALIKVRNAQVQEGKS